MDKTKYPLIQYRRFQQMLFTPLMLLLLTSSALYVLPIPAFMNYRTYWLIIALVALVTLILCILMRRCSYVVLGEQGIEIKGLFRHLTVPYNQVKCTRLDVFGRLFRPEKQNWSQRSFLEPFWGETVVVVELKKLPLEEGLIRLLFGKYLFEPERKSLVLLVDNWIMLRTKLDAVLEQKRLEWIDFEERRRF